MFTLSLTDRFVAPLHKIYKNAKSRERKIKREIKALHTFKPILKGRKPEVIKIRRRWILDSMFSFISVLCVVCTLGRNVGLKRRKTARMPHNRV